MSDTFTDDESGRMIKYLMLGAVAAMGSTPNFPLPVKVKMNPDETGTIQTVSFITESGLEFEVSVEYKGRVDDPEA